MKHFFCIIEYYFLTSVWLIYFDRENKMSNSHALEPLIPSSTSNLLTPTSSERSHSPDTDRNLCVMLDDRGKVFIVNISKWFTFSSKWKENKTHTRKSKCNCDWTQFFYRSMDALPKFDQWNDRHEEWPVSWKQNVILWINERIKLAARSNWLMMCNSNDFLVENTVNALYCLSSLIKLNEN